MSTQKFDFNMDQIDNAQFDLETRMFTFEVDGVQQQVYIAPKEDENRIEDLEFADGTRVSLEDIATAFNLPDILTAAGPGGGVPSGGSSQYVDDPGELIGGIDRLGGLDTFYWGRDTEVTERMEGFYRNGDSGPNYSIGITPIDPGDPIGTPEKPAIQYNLNTQGIDVTVNEAYIVNGTSNTTGNNPTYPIQFMISGNDTPASFTVNGVILNYVNGQLVFANGETSITLNNGTLTNPTLVQDNSGYILTFEFTQSHSEQHSEQGIDTADMVNTISVSVTGTNGSTASSNAIINIIDDIPEISVVDLVDVLQYASTPTEIGTVDYQYGADHDGTLELGINGDWLTVQENTPYEYYNSDGMHLGTIILVDNGNGYSVQFLQDKNAKGQHNIDLDFRVIDGDGDVVHGDNDARTDNNDPGIPDISITINEVKIEADPDRDWVKEDIKEVATGNILVNDNADLDFILDSFDGKSFVDGKVTVDTPYGILTVYENGNYEYQFKDTTPSLNRDFETDLQFDYTIKDEIGNIANSTLTINIKGTNDAPYIDSIVTGFELPDTGSVGYIKGQLNFGDVDTGDVAKISVDGNEINGKTVLELEDGNGTVIGELTINEDGSYYFVSKPGVIPPEGIEFEIPVSVSDGDLSNDASIKISLGINENATDAFKPKAEGDKFNVHEDGDAAGSAKSQAEIEFELGNVLANDKNAIGEVGADNLVAIEASYQGKYGTLYVYEDGSTKYILDNTNKTVNGLIDGEKVTDSFTYELKDTISGKSSFGTVDVDIAGRNDEASSLNSGLYISSGNGYTRSGSLVTGAEVTSWDDNGKASYTGNKDLIQDVDKRAGDQYEWTVQNGTKVEEGFKYQPDSINGKNLGNAAYNIPEGAIEGKYGWLILDSSTGKYTYVLDYNKIADWTTVDKANEVFNVKFVDKQTGAETDINLVFNITGREDTPTVDDARVSMTEDDLLCFGIVTSTTQDKFVNDPNDHSDKVKNDFWYTTPENAGVSKADAQNATTIVEGKYGWLELKGDGSYTYHKYHTIAELEQLAPGESVTEEFGVITHTPNQNVQNSGTIVITIEGTNDNPIATTEVVEKGWNGTFTITGQLDAFDIDNGDHVHYTQGGKPQVINTEHGYFEIQDNGSYTYTCTDPSFTGGVERGTYIVYDENGGQSEGKLIIVNHGTGSGSGTDPDIATDDVFTVKEDSHNVELDYKANDASGNELLLAPGHYIGKYGVLTVTEDGKMIYQLDNRNPEIQKLAEGEMFNDHESFIYKVINGTNVDEAEIKIFIEGVNDAPEFNPQTGMTITEAQPIYDALNDKWIPGEASIEFKMNVTDIDTALKDVTPVKNEITGTYGKLEVVFENGEWVGKYTLYQDDVVGKLNASSGNKTESFEVTFYDGYDFITKNIPITVKPFSDKAVNDSKTITEDQAVAVEIDYAANDTGKGQIGSAITGLGVSGGKLEVIDDTQTEILGKYGKLVYDPASDKMLYQLYDESNAGYNAVQGLNKGEYLNDVFTYQLTDAFGYSTTANVTVKINGIADGIESKNVEISATETTDRIEGYIEVADKDALYKFDTDLDGAHNALKNGDTSFISTLAISMKYVDENTDLHAVNGVYDTEYGQIMFDASTGKYTFLVDNDSVRHLGVGEFVTENFVITSVDEAGNTVSQNLDIVINGENDLPVVSNVSGIISNGVEEVSGNIIGFDYDTNDELSYSIENGVAGSDLFGNYTSVDNDYGTVKVYEDGTWKFTSNGKEIDSNFSKEFKIITSDGHDSVESNLNLDFYNTNNQVNGRLYVGKDNTADIFNFSEQDLSSGSQFISNFALGEDKIQFSDLLSNESSLDSILKYVETGVLKVEVTDINTAQLTINTGSHESTIGVQFDTPLFTQSMDESAAQAQFLAQLITG